MATLDQASLKQQFKDGAKPTGQDFADLIDTIQSGAPTEGTAPTPVSSQVAIEGTDTTGLVSPAGLKAHIDARLSEKGEAEAGTDATKLMTPLRTKEAISSQASPLITAAKNSLLGGVISSYNTLYKLYAYLVNNFYNQSAVISLITSSKNSILGGVGSSYNTLYKLYIYLVSNFYSKSTSDGRYDKKTDTIAGTRIGTGINAGNITSGTLPSAVRLPTDSVSAIQLTEISDLVGAAVGTDNLQDNAVKKRNIAANQVSADKLSFVVSPDTQTGYEPDTWWRLEIWVDRSGLRTLWMIGK